MPTFRGFRFLLIALTLGLFLSDNLPASTFEEYFECNKFEASSDSLSLNGRIEDDELIYAQKIALANDLRGKSNPYSTRTELNNATIFVSETTGEIFLPVFTRYHNANDKYLVEGMQGYVRGFLKNGKVKNITPLTNAAVSASSLVKLGPGHFMMNAKSTGLLGAIYEFKPGIEWGRVIVPLEGKSELDLMEGSNIRRISTLLSLPNQKIGICAYDRSNEELALYINDLTKTSPIKYPSDWVHTENLWDPDLRGIFPLDSFDARKFEEWLADYARVEIKKIIKNEKNTNSLSKDAKRIIENRPLLRKILLNDESTINLFEKITGKGRLDYIQQAKFYWHRNFIGSGSYRNFKGDYIKTPLMETFDPWNGRIGLRSGYDWARMNLYSGRNYCSMGANNYIYFQSELSPVVEVFTHQGQKLGVAYDEEDSDLHCLLSDLPQVEGCDKVKAKEAVEGKILEKLNYLNPGRDIDFSQIWNTVDGFASSGNDLIARTRSLSKEYSHELEVFFRGHLVLKGVRTDLALLTNLNPQSKHLYFLDWGYGSKPYAQNILQCDLKQSVLKQYSQNRLSMGH